MMIGMACLRAILALVALLATAVSPSAAAVGACAGRSLVTTLERERPAIWREALAEFADLPDASGLLWKVEKPGVEPSFLFGTMHVADLQLPNLRPEIQDAFTRSSVLVVESAEVLAEEADGDLMRRVMETALLPEGETFDRSLSDEDKALLGKLTAAHGIPFFAARKMQPWFLAVALAIPPCAKLAIARGEPVLDQALHQQALAAGKTIVGLETAEEQFAALAGLDNAVQLAALLELARLPPQTVEDWYATMVELYREERVMLATVLMRRLPEFQAGVRSLDDMQEPVISSRNRRMRDRLLPILDGGNAFVAIGALHLGGADGVIPLLRASGYKVSRIE